MSTLKTGFARLCINPPLGEPISGYYEPRFTKGILDDLYVTAVAVDDGSRRAVLMNLDLIMIEAERATKYRKMISEKSGVPMEAIYMTFSHTHTGPMIGKDFASDLVGSAAYETFMTSQMCDAVCYALADLKESQMSVGEGEAKNLSFIRRFRMKDGSVRTNPGVGHPDIKEALGTPNDAVKLVKFERNEADDIYIVNFGTHPDTVGGEYISADWPGFVRSTLEKALDGVKCMCLTGVQGDVNHINPNPTEGQKKGTFIDFDSVPRGYEHAKYMGRAIAGAVLQICDKTEPMEGHKISYGSSVVTLASNQENDRLEEAERIVKLHAEGKDAELPYTEMELTTVVAEATRIVLLKNGPLSYDFELSAVAIGDVAFSGFPGEPFVEIGRRVEAASPFAMTVTCCLVNGGDSYFPTSSAYDEGGYEARTSRLKKGADDVLVKGTTELLNQIKNS
ncbi:MAG: hypothetical protein E7414_05935 [Ruminococcaceae bacterium]|nr:hypothetical protein [Oscillospiraceae bacterium]